MLAGELEVFPMGWVGLPPDLMGRMRPDQPDVQKLDEWRWHHFRDDWRVVMCAAAAYWAQRARDLAAEELATAAVGTVLGGGPRERVTTAQLIGLGVEGWLRRLAGARDPERLHWALADRVLKDEPEAGQAPFRRRLGSALCDALRELADAVLPAFLEPDLELEEMAARAAEAALAWLRPLAVAEHTAKLAEWFSERPEAYLAAVGGPIALADRVPLLVGVLGWVGLGASAPSPPDGGWWIAPGGSNIHNRAAWSVADREPPTQPGEPALDERWGAPGGIELWLPWLPQCSADLDSVVVRAVAAVALARVREEEARRRKPALMLGLVRSLTRAASPGAVCEGGRISAPLEPGGRRLSAVPMVAGAADWAAGGNSAAVLALQIAAWLAFEAHRQMDAGMANPDRVLLPVGKEAFSEATGRIRASRGEIEAALEWLQSVRISGVAAGGLIYAWDATREISRARGRPTELLVVHVGEMLWPWRGLEWWRQHQHLEIPARLRFLSPLLPVTQAPLVGDKRTRGLQRSVWSLGVGAVLVEHREEYADRGGVEWATLKAGLKQLGLWERTHNSLAERWMEEACKPPAQLSLAGVASAAPLLRFEQGGRTLVRLGPDYADAEELVRGAADRTKAARAAQKRGASKVRK